MSKLIKEFKALENDIHRWGWVVAHKCKGISVILDNDQTIIVDTNIDADDLINTDVVSHAAFDNYIGYSEGIFNLLEAIGIDADCC